MHFIGTGWSSHRPNSPATKRPVVGHFEDRRKFPKSGLRGSQGALQFYE